MYGFRVYFGINLIGFFNEFDLGSEKKKLRMIDNLIWVFGNKWEV